jgi:hypothetical protein
MNFQISYCIHRIRFTMRNFITDINFHLVLRSAKSHYAFRNWLLQFKSIVNKNKVKFITLNSMFIYNHDHLTISRLINRMIMFWTVVSFGYTSLILEHR